MGMENGREGRARDRNGRGRWGEKGERGMGMGGKRVRMGMENGREGRARDRNGKWERKVGGGGGSEGWEWEGGRVR